MLRNRVKFPRYLNPRLCFITDIKKAYTLLNFYTRQWLHRMCIHCIALKIRMQHCRWSNHHYSGSGPHVEIKFKCMTGIEAGLLYCWDFYEFIKRCSIIRLYLYNFYFFVLFTWIKNVWLFERLSYKPVNECN